MSYARVVNDVITEFGLPLSARRLDTGEWVMGLDTAPVELVEACGYFVVDETAVQPAETATTFWAPSWVVVAGRPVRQWVETAKSAEQITAETRRANATTLQTQARTAINQCQTIIDDPNVTNAEAVTYIKQLATMNRAIIRLLIGSDLLD